jgi:hypothetical protein
MESYFIRVLANIIARKESNKPVLRGAELEVFKLHLGRLNINGRNLDLNFVKHMVMNKNDAINNIMK